MSVIISPGFDAFYCSFYIEGLIKVFGLHSIKYSRADFPKLRQHHCMALILPNGKKVFIDAQDFPRIDKEALSWCDVYAKINFDPNEIPAESKNKVLIIGPSFGVQVWGLRRTVEIGVRNYLKRRIKFNDHKRRREHFANYWRQYNHRLPLSAYTPHSAEDNYVFHLSSLWKKEMECNTYRSNFIKACESLSEIQFEGGFAPRRIGYVGGYESLTIDRRYSLEEYIIKLKRSLIVFNTPAVDFCHGWKLGEFLALGKAIISTPLTRPLPLHLEHCKHIHYVDGSYYGIKEAVKFLAKNKDYRRQLEYNARKYFLEHLAPEKCIERIICKC